VRVEAFSRTSAAARLTAAKGPSVSGVIAGADTTANWWRRQTVSSGLAEALKSSCDAARIFTDLAWRGAHFDPRRMQQVRALAEAIRDNREAAGRVAQARWAAQAAEHTRTAVEVIHTSPGPVWAAQRRQARGPQPAGPRQRLSAAQLAGMFDPGPITNLGPRPSSRTRGEHERDRDRDDKDYGR